MCDLVDIRFRKGNEKFYPAKYILDNQHIVIENANMFVEKG